MQWASSTPGTSAIKNKKKKKRTHTNTQKKRGKREEGEVWAAEHLLVDKKKKNVKRLGNVREEAEGRERERGVRVEGE